MSKKKLVLCALALVLWGLPLGGCGGGDEAVDDGDDDGAGGAGNGSGGAGSGTGGDASGSGGTSSGGAPSAQCSNVRPTGTDWDEATCDQWASDTTECGEDWMVDNDYCNRSCGRCSPSSGSGGVNGGGPSLDHGKFVGNITTQDQVNPQGLNYADHWDQVTPENAGKWGSVQYVLGGGYNWGTLDAIADYAAQNGIIFKQHAFVWGEQQPSGTPSREQVIDWIRSFCERYPDTKLIDVVNEPPPHTSPNYTNNIGGGTDGDWQWVTNSFLWAREHCPNSILLLNDYNNIEWEGDNQHFIDIVNTVLQSGGPIDAIGAQTHDLDEGRVTFDTVDRLLNKLHDDTGLPVYITELDLSYTDDQQQLEEYQRYFPYFMEQDFIPGITIWGWVYGQTWSKAPNSGLVRNGQARPAMEWLMNELGRPVP